MGLSIAREMIEKHGGKIGLESMEGMGSKFMFFLPSNAAQANAAQRVFHTGSLGNDGTGPLGKNTSSKPNTGNLIKSNTGNLAKNGKGGV